MSEVWYYICPECGGEHRGGELRTCLTVDKAAVALTSAVGPNCVRARFVASHAQTYLPHEVPSGE
jgi:ribosomal protein S27AE